MMAKWTGLHGPITADRAEAELEADRLFGPSYEARQRRIKAQAELSGIERDRFTPWRKPRIIRNQNSSTREGDHS